MRILLMKSNYRLLIPLSCIHSEIQIHDLSNNPGVVILKLGDVRIQTGNYEMAHIINLSEINTMVVEVTEWMMNLTNSTKFSKMLQYKFGQLQKAHNNLLQRHRKKRSIEFFGSVIKFIGGNPDASDFREVNNGLSTVRDKMNQIIVSNNDQVIINNQLNNRMNNVTRIISEMISSNEKRSLEALKDLDVLNLILNIDIAYGILEDIENVILLSKLGLISRNILDVKEIDLIIDLLKEQDVIVDSREQALEYLDVTVFYEKNSIVIMINIPQLQPEKFEKLMVKPITVKGQQMLIEHDYMLTNGEKTYGLMQACSRIGKIEICKNKDFVFLEDSCMSKIVKDQESKCSSKKAEEETFVEVMEPGRILVKTTNQTEFYMTNTCGLGPAKRSISKMMLITFENGSITINGSSYENYELESKRQTILYPIDQQKLEIEESQEFIDVRNLYDLHLNQRKHIEVLNWNHKVIKYVSYGISSTAIVSIIIAMVFLIIVKTKSKTKSNSLTIINAPTSPQENWDSSNLTKEELKATLY